MEYDYPEWNKFSDEDRDVIKGNVINYIEPDVSTQCDWFTLNTASGLLQAGLDLLHLGGSNIFTQQYYKNRRKIKRSSV